MTCWIRMWCQIYFMWFQFFIFLKVVKNLVFLNMWVAKTPALWNSEWARTRKQLRNARRSNVERVTNIDIYDAAPTGSAYITEFTFDESKAGSSMPLKVDNAGHKTFNINNTSVAIIRQRNPSNVQNAEFWVIALQNADWNLKMWCKMRKYGISGHTVWGCFSLKFVFHT